MSHYMVAGVVGCAGGVVILLLLLVGLLMARSCPMPRPAMPAEGE